MKQKRQKKNIDRKIVNAIKKGEYWYPERMDIWTTPEGKIARRELTQEGKFWSYKPSSKVAGQQKKAKKLNSHYTKVHRDKKAANSHALKIRKRKGKVKMEKTNGKHKLTYSF